jgi:hypothetical protein
MGLSIAKLVLPQALNENNKTFQIIFFLSSYLTWEMQQQNIS